MKIQNKTALELYELYILNNSDFDGEFFVGVKTTGIFCIPSCTSKAPLFKNVEFFNTKKEAIQSGYRGCKRCKSEYYPMLKPNWLQSLTRSLTNIPLDELNINKIQELSMVSYSTVHRNFKKYLNTTPNNYIQNLKMKQAIKLIKEGVDLTTVGFLCGYNSVSGFRHSFIQKFGVTPGTLKI